MTTIGNIPGIAVISGTAGISGTTGISGLRRVGGSRHLLTKTQRGGGWGDGLVTFSPKPSAGARGERVLSPSDNRPALRSGGRGSCHLLKETSPN